MYVLLATKLCTSCTNLVSGLARTEQTDQSSSDTESEASNGSHTFTLDDEVSEIMYNIFGECELLEEVNI